ncbi:TPA: hypothetical protein DD449_01660 [Candidatus Berkelbacteria bacterium]|uniref:DUF4870 domain-containing protein n=1 Tax=Berkelbacteria bacterium GW2011_GWE1_39_12 TaxID=1618337 RepID=A0A0G4B697_9BACT|nr:MAG: hypothetical protein UT28_C0001G0755 [Berkelbacteria bacterium GW2011_GWE1_39_12]HBO60374.1 hypothetical protein [Candidatus Berkelbacteria bacterium]
MGDESMSGYSPEQKERNFAAFVYLTALFPGDLAWGAYAVFGYLQGSKQLPKFVEFHLNQSKKFLLWSWPILVLILLPIALMMIIPTLSNNLLYVGTALAGVWLVVIFSVTIKAIVEARAGRWTKLWPNK